MLNSIHIGDFHINLAYSLCKVALEIVSAEIESHGHIFSNKDLFSCVHRHAMGQNKLLYEK